MLRSMFRIFFALAVTLSLTFGAFSGIGTSLAFAASSQPIAAPGYNPVASGPPEIGYCYPSGYNRQGWRCGWRLAMAPYNLGSYYAGYNYYGGYYYGGYGGRGYNNGYIADYGGRPRFGGYYYPCYYVNYYGYCN